MRTNFIALASRNSFYVPIISDTRSSEDMVEDTYKPDAVQSTTIDLSAATDPSHLQQSRFFVTETDDKKATKPSTQANSRFEVRRFNDDDESSSKEDQDDDKVMSDSFEHSALAAPRLSAFESVIRYQGGLIPSPDKEKDESEKLKPGTLGTLLGVYFPCIQNIIGVIIFIRLPWIIGVAGILESLLAIVICCLCTLLTAISLSAIATNGRVPGGGSYFLISRALGPEFGGAVGVLFYLANSLSAAMYVVGAVEILIKYICPKACKIFGTDVAEPLVALNHFRIYGVVLLFILGIAVLIGIRFVSFLAPISLFCVLFSILCIYIGIFKAAAIPPQTSVCILDAIHLLKSNVLDNQINQYCFPNNSVLVNATCGNQSPLCPLTNQSKIENVITGLSKSQFIPNLYSAYTKKGEIQPSVEALDPQLEVTAQSLTTWLLIIGIYFPSVTGIMAGSNRSGDLKNPGKSIPRGTIAAILTTSTIYISYVFLVGSSVQGILLRDKFGDSINKGLVISHLAWPSKYVILVGALLSTLGAGLQALTGAPRILQAVAKDDVIPFLHFFSITSPQGEPRRAVGLTVLIALIGVLIADLDKLTPLLSMFFLLCYGFVNLACALRYRFSLFPFWSIMFIASWYFAIVALVIALLVYKYIEYKGAEKEWGDGIAGLQLTAARFALNRLEEKEVHTKNWRPELLMFTAINEEDEVINENMFAFARQLKAGGGLVVACTFCVTNSHLNINALNSIRDCKKSIMAVFAKYKMHGFKSVFTTRSYMDGFVTGIQCSGLGGMRPNTVVLCWPTEWQHLSADESFEKLTYQTFINVIRHVDLHKMAILVPKNISLFPTKGEKQQMSSTIDIWWILHDAGLMILWQSILKCRLYIAGKGMGVKLPILKANIRGYIQLNVPYLKAFHPY
ncbi:hypothetical protein ACOME3_005291 [Neoechinorhynchus agilis]